MHTVYFVLFLLAVVCFALEFIMGAMARRLNFVALGLALGFAAFMVQQAKVL